MQVEGSIMNTVTRQINTQCVYKIESKQTKEILYVGSSEDFSWRRMGHIYSLNGGAHHCEVLQNHANIYTYKDLDFIILEVVRVKRYLRNREQYYIDLCQPLGNTYKARPKKRYKIKRRKPYKKAA